LEGKGDISELLNTLKEPKEAMEIRIKLLAENVQAEGARVTSGFKEWVDEGAEGNSSWSMETENFEGWRIRIAEKDGNYGWLLLRPSLHDPDIVINVESEEEGGMARHLAHLMRFFMQHPEYCVCTKEVEKYIGDKLRFSKS